MGVDLTLTADHAFRPPTLAAAARAFEPVVPCFEEIATYLAPWLPHLGPPLEPWAEHPRFPPRYDRGQLLARAPAGFTMWFGPRAVYMRHVLPFDRLTGDERCRGLLHRFARESMRALGTSEILYCPSEVIGDEARDGVVDGSDLQGILAVFTERFGSPAPAIEDMAMPGASRYYVEGLSEVDVSEA
jgi:hypothetical protein